MSPLSLVQIVATLCAALFAGAILIGAVVPFTFVVIMPTNDALLAPDRDLARCAPR